MRGCLFITTIAFLLILSGCTLMDMRHRKSPDTTDNQNISLILQCNQSCIVPMRIEGKVFIKYHDILRSNCSAHMANHSVTIICPRAELPVSEKALMAGSLLPGQA